MPEWADQDDGRRSQEGLRGATIGLVAVNRCRIAQIERVH